jgi:hypothetical protein
MGPTGWYGFVAEAVDARRWFPSRWGRPPGAGGNGELSTDVGQSQERLDRLVRRLIPRLVVKANRFA